MRSRPNSQVPGIRRYDRQSQISSRDGCDVENRTRMNQTFPSDCQSVCNIALFLPFTYTYPTGMDYIRYTHTNNTKITTVKKKCFRIILFSHPTPHQNCRKRSFLEICTVLYFTVHGLVLCSDSPQQFCAMFLRDNSKFVPLLCFASFVQDCIVLYCKSSH